MIKMKRNYLWFGLGLFFLGLFLKFTSELYEENTIQIFDKVLMLFVGEHIRNHVLNNSAVDITALGSATLVTFFSIVVCIVLRRLKDMRGLITYLTCIAGGAMLSFFLKFIVARPRPQIISHLVNVNGSSYPSGHTVMSVVAFFAIARLIDRHVKDKFLVKINYALCFITVLCIALSRIYLGVHYPSDVASGIMIGLSWVLMVTSVAL